MSDLLHLDPIAQFLNTPVQELEDAIERGELQGQLLGGRYYIAADSARQLASEKGIDVDFSQMGIPGPEPTDLTDDDEAVVLGADLEGGSAGSSLATKLGPNSAANAMGKDPDKEETSTAGGDDELDPAASIYSLDDSDEEASAGVLGDNLDVDEDDDMQTMVGPQSGLGMQDEDEAEIRLSGQESDSPAVLGNELEGPTTDSQTMLARQSQLGRSDDEIEKNFNADVEEDSDASILGDELDGSDREMQTLVGGRSQFTSESDIELTGEEPSDAGVLGDELEGVGSDDMGTFVGTRSQAADSQQGDIQILGGSEAQSDAGVLGDELEGGDSDDMGTMVGTRSQAGDSEQGDIQILAGSEAQSDAGVLGEELDGGDVEMPTLMGTRSQIGSDDEVELSSVDEDDEPIILGEESPNSDMKTLLASSQADDQPKVLGDELEISDSDDMQTIIAGGQGAGDDQISMALHRNEDSSDAAVLGEELDSGSSDDIPTMLGQSSRLSGDDDSQVTIKGSEGSSSQSAAVLGEDLEDFDDDRSQMRTMLRSSSEVSDDSEIQVISDADSSGPGEHMVLGEELDGGDSEMQTSLSSSAGQASSSSGMEDSVIQLGGEEEVEGLSILDDDADMVGDQLGNSQTVIGVDEEDLSDSVTVASSGQGDSVLSSTAAYDDSKLTGAGESPTQIGLPELEPESDEVDVRMGSSGEDESDIRMAPGSYPDESDVRLVPDTPLDSDMRLIDPDADSDSGYGSARLDEEPSETGSLFRDTILPDEDDDGPIVQLPGQLEGDAEESDELGAPPSSTPGSGSSVADYSEFDDPDDDMGTSESDLSINVHTDKDQFLTPLGSDMDMSQPREEFAPVPEVEAEEDDIDELLMPPEDEGIGDEDDIRSTAEITPDVLNSLQAIDDDQEERTLAPGDSDLNLEDLVADTGSDLLLDEVDADQASQPLEDDDAEADFDLELDAPDGPEMEEPSEATSIVDLDDEDQEDFVLDDAGSMGGSDLTLNPSDSGIGIGGGDSLLNFSTGDSGLDLGGSSLGYAGSSANIAADESEFLLSPADDAGDEEESDSGSQVIALDEEEMNLGGHQPTMLGEDMEQNTILGEDYQPSAMGSGIGFEGASGIGMASSPMGSGIDSFGAGMSSPGMGSSPGYSAPDLSMGGYQGGAPASYAGSSVGGVMPAGDVPYTPGDIAGLAGAILFLFLGGMLMTDLVSNIWVWEGAGMSKGIMDFIMNAINY